MLSHCWWGWCNLMGCGDVGDLEVVVMEMPIGA